MLERKYSFGEEDLNKSSDLSHHRAYRSVHGGSLVFTNLQIIAGHRCIALTGYFFILQSMMKSLFSVIRSWSDAFG
ncbi:hypothetical protein, partial [uncultured Anaerovibrio sp.]|uniref:hypothetical protein n=1 Tax=uncultured Anaerovibrio sp. TaxID=361586 RepID=UPI00260DA3BA